MSSLSVTIQIKLIYKHKYIKFEGKSQINTLIISSIFIEDFHQLC